MWNGNKSVYDIKFGRINNYLCWAHRMLYIRLKVDLRFSLTRGYFKQSSLWTIINSNKLKVITIHFKTTLVLYIKKKLSKAQTQ